VNAKAAEVDARAESMSFQAYHASRLVLVY
jgi:hypothetical protein